MTILDTIIEAKHKEVLAQKWTIPIPRLEKQENFTRNTLSLKASLTKAESTGIISEFKRKSPSKGVINNKVNVGDVIKGYVAAGAAGLSILTDKPFFGGTIADLVVSRYASEIPILRKDFIIDEYQLFEAKAFGADVVLLIAAVLTHEQVKKLATCAKSLGLEILFEVHSQEDLEKLVDEIDMVGVNNRNLHDFTVDIEHSLRLVAQLPDSFVKVSESGIDNPETIKYLQSYGFQGFLIGENFMKTPNPGKALEDFIGLL